MIPLRIPHWQQPAGDARASADARRYLTSLYLLRGVAAVPDLVGDNHIAGLAMPAHYSAGAVGGLVGLRGSGADVAGAKGLYTRDALPTGNVENAGFAIFTLDSLSSGSESSLFRATNGPDGTGVAIDIFPATRTIRCLLQGVSWQSSNDRSDSRLVVGVPWFVGYHRIAGAYWCYSAPLGERAIRLGANISTATLGVYPAGPMHIGGMAYSGVGVSTFPGVIHAVGYSNRPMPEDWLAGLPLAPWRQLFAPQRIVVPAWTASAAPDLPTLTALTISDITQTSARWTVS